MRILTIIPFPLAPRIEAIATGWIYDLQLWDMGAVERDLASRLRDGQLVAGEAGELYSRIKAHAGQRKVLVALGVQSKEKGFSTLADLAQTVGMQDWLIVALGTVASDQASAHARLAATGHLIEDRFVDDTELIAAYAAADAVWCLYDKDYDQASGILGRALQFGVAPIVRKGSLSEKLCVVESIPHVAALDASSCAVGMQAMPATDPERGEALAERFREISLASLSIHLFGARKLK